MREKTIKNYTANIIIILSVIVLIITNAMLVMPV
jgi:hypothetical protein